MEHCLARSFNTPCHWRYTYQLATFVCMYFVISPVSRLVVGGELLTKTPSHSVQCTPRYWLITDKVQ
ncbi:hypothetical protein BJX66DRAFT_310294 [Aspergillus keveii]|uniref:Uncharacterized protein n=1 Tax=Aspergillus keveii TaxID=714993 RepID=A0ABR4FWU6_9EURO